MKFEEVLPALREGRKARRKIDADEGYIQLDKSCGKLCDFNNDGEWFDVTEFSAEDVLADDWELVPEKRKFSREVYLWSNGTVSTSPAIGVNTPSLHVIETRTIEWEVEE